MVDLETLSTESDALVLSFAAREFFTSPDATLTTGIALKKNLNMTDQIHKGRNISGSTLEWWAEQKASVLSSNIVGGKGVNNATQLNELNDFINGSIVWGNGATFDNVITRSLLADYRIEPSWKFWNDQCYRTIKNTFDPAGRLKPKDVAGDKHDPLFDVDFQLAHLRNIDDVFYIFRRQA